MLLAVSGFLGFSLYLSRFLCLPSFVARRHPRHETFCSSNCLGPTGMYFGALFLAVWFSTKPQALVRFRIRTASLWFLIFSTTDRIVSAVEVAAGKSTRQQMGQAIREAFWPMFRFPNDDVHVLISRGEMAFANAATEGGVARFKIRHGGQDLFITLFKRNAKAINGGQALNYGHGTRSDLDILRSFGKGLYDLQNIFQPQSLEWIFKQTQEVFSKGLSPDKMAQRLESLMHQTYGGGWNVIVSPNKITAVVHERDVKAAFKAMGKLLSFWIFWTGSDNPRAPSGYLLGYQVAQSETPHSWKQTHVFVARDQLFSPENCIFSRWLIISWPSYDDRSHAKERHFSWWMTESMRTTVPRKMQQLQLLEQIQNTFSNFLKSVCWSGVPNFCLKSVCFIPHA